MPNGSRASDWYVSIRYAYSYSSSLFSSSLFFCFLRDGFSETGSLLFLANVSPMPSPCSTFGILSGPKSLPSLTIGWLTKYSSISALNVARSGRCFCPQFRQCATNDPSSSEYLLNAGNPKPSNCFTPGSSSRPWSASPMFTFCGISSE
jgi:hypothetical protein